MTQIYAQNSPIEVEVGADIVSRYVWRGTEIGATEKSPATPHIQPYGSITYSFNDDNSLSLGVWGSYGFNSDYNESDIYLNYYLSTGFGDFSATVSDYYYPYSGISFSDFSDDGAGAHTIEANLEYTIPYSIPVRIMASANIYNALPNEETTYFQVTIPVQVNDVDVECFAGAGKGFSEWHGISTSKYELINFGVSATKSMKFTSELSIPLGVSWIWNPHANNTFVVLKVSI